MNLIENEKSAIIDDGTTTPETEVVSGGGSTIGLALPHDLPRAFRLVRGEIESLASQDDYEGFVGLWDNRYELARSELPFYHERPEGDEIIDFLCLFQHFRHSIIAGFMEPTMQVTNQRRVPKDVRRDFVKAVALSMFEEQGIIPGEGFEESNLVLSAPHHALYATSARPFGADVNREVWERKYRVEYFETLQRTLSGFILGTAHKEWPGQLRAVSLYAFIERTDGTDYRWFLDMIDRWAAQSNLSGRDLRDARMFW
jgi:hypothetical protein